METLGVPTTKDEQDFVNKILFEDGSPARALERLAFYTYTCPTCRALQTGVPSISHALTDTLAAVDRLLKRHEKLPEIPKLKTFKSHNDCEVYFEGLFLFRSRE